MSKIFITYGDAKFLSAKTRILKEASLTGWFDSYHDYSDKDISEELKSSGLMNFNRGGGLWSWKPDIINKAMHDLSDGDILVYADSGCSLVPCEEWSEIETILKQYDIIAQRILQPTYKWTRREIIEGFPSNPRNWIYRMQFCATVIILRVTPFTRKFIGEWRQLILSNPIWIQDVGCDNLNNQLKGFRENRHDQAVYSALVNKYLSTGNIYAQWERIENYDIIRRQAIRASRLRYECRESYWLIAKKMFKRFTQAYLIYPIRELLNIQ